MNRQHQEIIIQQFILRARININLCDKIENFIFGNQEKRINNLNFEYIPEISFLRLTANNSFKEAVLIASSLLNDNGKNREWSFGFWIDGFNNDVRKKQIEEIKQNFKDKGFLKIRHNIIGHKNIDHFHLFEFNTMKPMDDLHCGIKENYRKDLIEIIVKLEKFIQDHFDKNTICEDFGSMYERKHYSQEIGASSIFEFIKEKICN